MARDHHRQQATEATSPISTNRKDRALACNTKYISDKVSCTFDKHCTTQPQHIWHTKGTNLAHHQADSIDTSQETVSDTARLQIGMIGTPTDPFWHNNRMAFLAHYLTYLLNCNLYTKCIFQVQVQGFQQYLPQVAKSINQPQNYLGHNTSNPVDNSIQIWELRLHQQVIPCQTLIQNLLKTYSQSLLMITPPPTTPQGQILAQKVTLNLGNSEFQPHPN